jgi:hypothetical protein
MPPAVSGNRGHDATFAVALALCHGFALSKAQALPIMREFNARCDPLWSEKELEHKLDSAGKVTRHSKPRGHLLGERGPLASAKAEPAVTTFNIDTSEPLPPEQWRRLPKGNSEKGVPSVPTNDPPNEKSEKGVAGVPGQLAEAQRIAGELVKLYHVGAISGPDDLEAVFYAHVIGAFGGAVLKNSPGQTLSAGEHPEPVDTVPEPPPVFRRKRGWNSTPTTWRPRLVRNTSITTISRRSFTPELHPRKKKR